MICFSALKNRGATSAEAETVFEDYLDAEMRGRECHGFVSFHLALEAFPHRGRYSIERIFPSMLDVEGNGDCGHIVARAAIEYGIKLIPEQGQIKIGIRNITRFNTAGTIARFAAERGMICQVMEYSGRNATVPFGGKYRSLGTNPIGLAIPYTEPLFVYDGSTSERSLWHVRLAKMRGETVDASVGVDSRGRSATDPSRIVAVRPSGGYKGFALGLFTEIMTGPFLGVPIGMKGRRTSRGALIWISSPAAFKVSIKDFKQSVNQFLQEVVSTEPVKKDSPVRYPGQRSEERRNLMLKSGVISIPDVVIARLKRWAST